MLSFRTTAELNEDISRAAPMLMEGCEAVIGVPRSGVLAASMLALHVQVPLGTVDEYCEGVGTAGECTRVLVLDDTVCGGGTMRRAVERIREARLDAELVRAAVYRAPGTDEDAVDRYFDTVPTPRAFEWNIWRSVYLPECCLDMDGVLCEDPDFVDHGDERYERHVTGADPRWIPSRPVRAIVTCRLDRWREQTADWLARHGVHYHELHMMDYPDAQARRAAGRHARWKAEVYEEVGGELFIESSSRQAASIAQIAGRQVFCTDNRRVYGRAA